MYFTHTHFRFRKSPSHLIGWYHNKYNSKAKVAHISSVCFWTYFERKYHLLNKLYWVLYIFNGGFPGGVVGKESACNVGDLDLIPALRRPPGEGNSYPLPHSCLGNPMDREAWWAAAHGVQRVRHDWVTAHAPMHAFLICRCVYKVCNRVTHMQ